MGRRRHGIDECIGAPACKPDARWLPEGIGHGYRCPCWGLYLERHAAKAFLGSTRTPYEKWIETASMYPWPLWRNWKPPKPMKVETTADVTRRLLSYKPAGYTWRIERLTPAQRIALGCLPKPAVRATRKRVREAA